MRRLFPLFLFSAMSVFGRGGGGGAGGGGGGGFGGGFHYVPYGRSGGVFAPIIGDGAWAFWLLAAIFGTCFGLFLIRKGRAKKKLREIRKLLKHLMNIDPVWDEAELKSHVESSFLEIQRAWCDRDFSTLDALLTPKLSRDWKKKIHRAKKRGQRDVMKGTKLLRCTVVNVQDYLDDDLDNFTVELHAFSNDWTIDRQERIVDKREPLFTEFWTYRRKENNWLLEKVRQVGEAGEGLKDNFVERTPA